MRTLLRTLAFAGGWFVAYSWGYADGQAAVFNREAERGRRVQAAASSGIATPAHEPRRSRA